MSLVRDIARISYEVNRSYCNATGDVAVPAGPPWDVVDTEARHRHYKMVRYHLQAPETPPEQLHAEWLRAHKISAWIYGPVKSYELREHPCMVPWADLPEQQRFKTRLCQKVCAVANQMLAAQENTKDRRNFGTSRKERAIFAARVCSELCDTMPLQERDTRLFEPWDEGYSSATLDQLLMMAESIEAQAPKKPQGAGNQAWFDLFYILYTGILGAHALA